MTTGKKSVKRPAGNDVASAGSGELRGILLHLSTNMWTDRVPREAVGRWRCQPQRCVPDRPLQHHYIPYSPVLRFSDEVWEQLLPVIASSGLNTIVLDIGDGLRYESHPEIAVKGAWTVKKMRREIEHCRSLGLTIIPKLNFSTRHDRWLGRYSRCVSTDTYYGVCRDLIAEVLALFRPRVLHIGMDEEKIENFRHYEYAVVRQYDLWWHDLYFFVDEVEKHNCTAWMWSDYIWDHADEFIKKMPRTVLQSNWYYDAEFSAAGLERLSRRSSASAQRRRRELRAFDLLERRHFQQIPCGSTWLNDSTMAGIVHYCRKRIAPQRLAGFLNAPWAYTLPEFSSLLERTAVLTGRAMFEDGRKIDVKGARLTDAFGKHGVHLYRYRSTRGSSDSDKKTVGECKLMHDGGG